MPDIHNRVGILLGMLRRDASRRARSLKKLAPYPGQEMREFRAVRAKIEARERYVRETESWLGRAAEGLDQMSRKYLDSESRVISEFSCDIPNDRAKLRGEVNEWREGLGLEPVEAECPHGFAVCDELCGTRLGCRDARDL